MADVYFDSWESLVHAVNQRAHTILRRDVAEPAKKILKQHIADDLYGVYTPKQNGWVTTDWQPITYQRRHVLEKALWSGFEDYNTMVVTSLAAPSPSVGKSKFHSAQQGSFLEMIESGNTGLWRGGFARFPVTRTQNDFYTNTKIYEAIRKGIRREIGNCTII